MLDFDSQRLEEITKALKEFTNRTLKDSALGLFSAMGYESEKTADFGTTPEQFIRTLEQGSQSQFNREKAEFSKWRECSFLFQLTNDEIPSLTLRQKTIAIDTAYAQAQMESFVFLALELTGTSWSRTQLAAITREINKHFPMPAIVLFRHSFTSRQVMADAGVSLAVIDRRINLRDASRDVIDHHITLVKDVNCANPHRAHLDIIAGLAPENLGERHCPTNFRDLYDAWIASLSIQALNKRFYTELAYWYLWAVQQVEFPKGGGVDESKRNAVAVIRLLTRLIFVWFIKEKRLIPEDLFDAAKLKALLKSDPGTHSEDSNYYFAILQNLFFATLNVEMGNSRKWADHNSSHQKGDRLIHSVYRHKELFSDPTTALELFSSIPFLNGGLFECLDRELTERDFQRNPELKALASKEGSGWVLRVDGFSRRKDAQPKVPNKLFFTAEEKADLNADLGTQGKTYPVHGLLNIFSRYKFTVDENTPVEEEVALDPELLGRVFENLLASYNEDTKTTARKLSGSFYTPREVVDYMVDESLIAYFAHQLAIKQQTTGKKILSGSKRPINEVLDFEAMPGELDLTLDDIAPRNETENAQTYEPCLHNLLAYTDNPHEFNETETQTLIEAIEKLKILDPACGSGAFPMGVLQKLVHVLKKLDPANTLWKAQNRAPLEQRLRLALASKDLTRKDSDIEQAEQDLERFDRDFSSGHLPDYTRKLYLIDKCIHGVDIQPIAVQIAKLRFFIALVVSQEVDRQKDNWGITALPNLETKIVAADSLTPIDRPAQLGLRDVAIDDMEKELTEANGHYFSARTVKTKRRWREKIFELRDELSRLLEEDRFLPEGSARQLVQWNPFDQNAAADFFDPEWMFQLADGFDIAIGNPPYVRQESIISLKPKLKAHYQCYTGTADLYVYFYERAIKLLKPHGVFAFITSNKWYRAKYGEKLRDWMNKNTRIKSIIDFGDANVFDAITYPTIVIATRRPQPVKAPGQDEDVLALNWTQEYPVGEFRQVFAQEAFPVPQAGLGKDGWQLEQPLQRRLLECIRAAGTPLGKWCGGRFYRGILTGYNEAFVIDGAKRERLIAEDPKSAEIIKPFLRGRDVKRWRVEFANQYLIKIESSENKPHPWSEKNEKDAEIEFARCYPAIHAYFEDYRQGMIDRCDQGRFFWELRSCAYWQEFEKPKIIYPDIYEHQSFTWDTKGYFSANTCYFIPTDSLWVTGLLNSPLIEWFYSQLSNRIRGGYLRSFSDYMQQVPIPKADDKHVTLIDAAISAVLAEIEAPYYEQLINGLVYELFFPEDLHRAKLHLFDACEKTGLGKLATLQGKALTDAANDLATCIFANDHPI